MKDLYALLGVSPNASPEEIKKAYRRLAREHHPDLNRDDSEAEKRFKEITRAYEVLSDPQRRRRYDLYGDAELSPAADRGFGDFGSPFGDIFDMFFGRGRRESAWGPQRGSDLNYRLALTLEEAFTGVEKEIEVPRHRDCEECGGTGLQRGYNLDLCPACGGEGRVTTSKRTAFGTFTSTSTCRRCGGSGGINSHPCGSCGGAGTVYATEKVELKIPAGVDDGDRMRITGKGEAGLRGGPAGDLFVVMELQPHPFFERRGNDLWGRVRVSVAEAALGAEVEVDLLDGRERLKVPPGSQPGRLFVMRKRGMPVLRTHRRGDLYLELVVEIPERLSHEEKRLFRELARLQADNGKDRRSPVPRESRAG
jgi:molecular chaperone DnaJ